LGRIESDIVANVQNLLIFYFTLVTAELWIAWRVSLSVDILLSAVSVLVIVLQSPEIPEGLMNNPVFFMITEYKQTRVKIWPAAPYFCLIKVNIEYTQLYHKKQHFPNVIF
jgi:hypothetical protein